ncbi:FMN-binding negative transcriptional regulator [Chitinophaga pendula]|uniref:FMN-binding negative transcriptional regulator n=1 Tax=Chitinophaga TaxID=79328 RepID=UPI000BB01CD9|nr:MULTISPECIES: FMN-binding negative transcriptional regulator [Chitinophaga]ASZ13915.1 transcriptional regulator [Chitinophaga sp. MD30]UCJ08467.1 FMN-binding negative transcriptional regulator [Chitinophaga pendula]
MYIPHHFQFDDNSEMVAFMKQYSFATVVSTKDGIPIATHLPFSVNEYGDKLLLVSHFAAANEQAKCIEDTTILVIFSEPHAYISPSLYDKEESVPTWNYMAVHAYGKARIISDESMVESILRHMITAYEPDYLSQWESLSDRYKKGMMKAIVAFEIEVTDLQGSKKLSQNKSLVERQRIAIHLEKSGDGVEALIAGYMKEISK